MDQTIGLICGFLCALSHSLCYLFTRRFLIKDGRSSFQLICIGHIYMGIFSVIALALFWQTPEAGWEAIILPLAGAAGFYFLAQASFFRIATWAPASRISPLLGIKIVFLAIIASIFAGANLSILQWVAVGVCLLAALILARGGGEKLELRVILGVMLTCCLYSGSDTNIQKLVRAIASEPSFESSCFAMALTYIVCAIPAVIGIFFLKSENDMPALKDAFAFSLSWYSAMIFLFSAIAFLGVVPAVIVQSTRGPLSIGLGLIVAKLGHHALETRLIRSDAIKYLSAAVLMCLAIAIYTLS